MTLEQTLADWRERATLLRSLGHPEQADAIVQVVDDVAKVGEPVIRFVSEDRAQLYCQKTVRWLRSRFAAWESQGLAKWDDRGRRWYLLVALPVPLDLAATAADAERTAREDAA